MPRHVPKDYPKLGEVTQLVASKRRPERVNVFVDGEFAIQVHVDIIAKHHIRKGMMITEEISSLLHTDKRGQQVRRLAFAYVSFKPRTEKQIRDRLAKREYSVQEIDEALEFCKEFGLADDSAFARMYVHDALLLKKLSPQRLRADLMRKGVAKHIAEEAVRREFPPDDVTRIALDAAIKKQRAVAYRSPEKQRSAIVSYLQRSGFSWEVISATLDKILISNRVQENSHHEGSSSDDQADE